MLASVGVLLLMHMTEMFTTQYPGLHNSVLLVYLFLFTVFVFLLPSHFRKLSLSNVPVNIIFGHCQLWPSVLLLALTSQVLGLGLGSQVLVNITDPRYITTSSCKSR